VAKTEEPIVCIDRYISQLKRCLENQYWIKEPKRLESILIASRDKQGNVLGWAIMRQEIIFRDEDFLDVDEYAQRIDGGYAKITTFSYHFHPVRSGSLREWRIDFKDNDLHVNPDEGHNKHLEPDKVPLNVRNFNLYLTLILTTLYMSKRVYPFEAGAEAVYRLPLENGRRRLNGA